MPMQVFKPASSISQRYLSSGWIFLINFILSPMLSFDGWNYLNNDDLLNEVSVADYADHSEADQPQLWVAILVFQSKNHLRGFLLLKGYSTLDRYINGDVFISTDKLDELELTGSGLDLIYRLILLTEGNMLLQGGLSAFGRTTFP